MENEEVHDERSLEERIEDIEFGIPKELSEKEKRINLRFDCWDRAIGAITRENNVPKVEDALEWADQIYKFVTKEDK